MMLNEEEAQELVTLLKGGPLPPADLERALNLATKLAEEPKPTAQLVIQTIGPFRVFCNTCGRFVDGDRVNIDGTHDSDESKPARTGRGIPPPARTGHTVWDFTPKFPREGAHS
jgi:hypothetical protein